MDKEISIILYDDGFRERAALVDCLNKQTVRRDDYEIIWVENGNKVNEEVQKKNMRTFALGRDVYNLSKCVNYAIERAKGKIVAVMDADTIVNSRLLEEALQWHDHQDNLVLYAHRWDEREPAGGKMGNNNIRRLEVVCELINPNNFGGFMSVRKEHLWEMNGYEELPIFSGPDSAAGLDLNVRFDNYGLDWQWHPSLKVYHPWHPSAHREWRGFRVESQWKMVDHRCQTGEYKAILGLNGRDGELGEWWSKWLDRWNDKSVGYKPKL